MEAGWATDGHVIGVTQPRRVAAVTVSCLTQLHSICEVFDVLFTFSHSCTVYMVYSMFSSHSSHSFTVYVMYLLFSSHFPTVVQ